MANSINLYAHAHAAWQSFLFFRFSFTRQTERLKGIIYMLKIGWIRPCTIERLIKLTYQLYLTNLILLKACSCSLVRKKRKNIEEFFEKLLNGSLKQCRLHDVL